MLIFLLSSNRIITGNEDNLFNGWEFLPWGASIQEVEDELTRRNIEFESALMNQMFPATVFQYQGFNTSLHYDNGLYDVQQNRYFNSNELDESREVFDTFHLELENRFGKSFETKAMESKKTVEWNTKYSKIRLVYQFKPGIYILMQFNPIKP